MNVFEGIIRGTMTPELCPKKDCIVLPIDINTHMNFYIENTKFSMLPDKRGLIIKARNGLIATDTILWDGNDYHNQLQIEDDYFDLQLCYDEWDNSILIIRFL